MKQDVIVREKSGLIFSKDLTYLIGLTNFDFESKFPSGGVNVYYDLEDMNCLPFKLFKKDDGTYYVF